MHTVEKKEPKTELAELDQPTTSLSSLLKIFFWIAIVAIGLTIFVWYRQREWRVQGQRGVVIVHTADDPIRRPITLAITTAEDPTTYIVQTPRDQKITLPESDVEYMVDALEGIREIEQKSWSSTLLTLSLEYGIVFDGVVWTDIPFADFTPQKLNKISTQIIFNRTPTTLSRWDRFTWWRLLRQVPSFKRQVVTIDQYLANEKTLNQATFDPWARLKWQDWGARQSELAVAVLNASGVQGQASRFARMLELVGYEVRSVDTIPEQEQSQLILTHQVLESPQEEWALDRLQTLFDSFDRTEDAAQLERRRVEAIIILGKELN